MTHVRTLMNSGSKIFTALVAAALIFTWTSQADAHHEPANKFAASGSDVDDVGEDEVVLSETMKVSTPFDLILSLTAECSILTELTTNNDDPSSSAFGSVRMRIEIDDVPVPVASDDATGGQDDADDDDDETGEVTFCNRAYGRTVSDDELLPDGQDDESDYIRTRAANAFNWIALNVGDDYDTAANGNNIVKIEVIADYDVETTGDALADAFVGSRTLIAEPTNASVHEQVQPQGGAGS